MNKLWLVLGVFLLFLVLVLTHVSIGDLIPRSNRNSVISRFADAIAYAEGFYTPGSRAARNHNPGDLTKDLTGKGIGFDGPFVIYRTDDDGFEALQKQVELMFYGSSIYNSSMSILEVARQYTKTEVNAWAFNVASRLGVDTNTRLSEVA